MGFISNLKHEDHRKALYASLIFIMLMILFFLLISFEEPDPPLKPEVVEIQMPDIEIEEGSQEEGGSSSEEVVSNPTPVNEVVESAPEVVTQEEVTVPVPSGNDNSTADNPTNEVSEPQPDETFGFPVGGGNGQGSGSGDLFGSGDGVGGNGQGNTSGNGSADLERKVLKKPTFNANAQEEGRVALDIWVDQNGNVIKTRYKETASTTGSQYLIGLAKKAAKTMKYDKKSGVASEYVGYKVFAFKKS